MVISSRFQSTTDWPDPGVKATDDLGTGSWRAVAASAGEVIPAATAAMAARIRVFPVLRMLYGSSRLGSAGRAGSGHLLSRLVPCECQVSGRADRRRTAFAAGHRLLARRISGVVSRRSIRPAVARTVTASSIPRAAVAASGIRYGLRKPDAAACGTDARPMSTAAQPAQRRPARHPRAVRAVSAAAGSPAVTSPAVRAGWREGPAPPRHDEAAPGQVQGGRGQQDRHDQAPNGLGPRGTLGLPAPGIGGAIRGQAVIHSGRRDRVVLFELLAHGIQRVVQP